MVWKFVCILGPGLLRSRSADIIKDHGILTVNDFSSTDLSLSTEYACLVEHRVLCTQVLAEAHLLWQQAGSATAADPKHTTRCRTDHAASWPPACGIDEAKRQRTECRWRFGRETVPEVEMMCHCLLSSAVSYTCRRRRLPLARVELCPTSVNILQYKYWARGGQAESFSLRMSSRFVHLTFPGKR